MIGPSCVSKVRRTSDCPRARSAATRAAIACAGSSTRVRGGGTGSPSIAIRRSGKRSGGRSAPQAGHQTAEKLAWGSMNRPGNGRPCERKALRLATAVSAARPTPTTTIADSVARESVGPSSPLSAIGCHNSRAQGSCQDDSDRRASVGAAEDRLQRLEPGAPRRVRWRRSRPRRCRSRDERVPPARRGPGPVQASSGPGFGQRSHVARQPAQRLPHRHRRQKQPAEARGQARVVAAGRQTSAAGTPHLAPPGLRELERPATRRHGSGTGRVASSARQTGSSAARHAARAIDHAIADLEAVAETIARVEDAGAEPAAAVDGAGNAGRQRQQGAQLGGGEIPVLRRGRAPRRPPRRRSPGWSRRRRSARSSAAAHPALPAPRPGRIGCTSRPAGAGRAPGAVVPGIDAVPAAVGVARRDRVHPGLAREIIGPQRGAVVLPGVVARRIADGAEDRRAAPAPPVAGRLPQHVAQVGRRPPGAVAHRDRARRRPASRPTAVATAAARSTAAR